MQRSVKGKCPVVVQYLFSGLVTGGDLVEQLKEEPGARVLITECMLRDEGDRFLDDVTPCALRLATAGVSGFALYPGRPNHRPLALEDRDRACPSLSMDPDPWRYGGAAGFRIVEAGSWRVASVAFCRSGGAGSCRSDLRLLFVLWN